MAKAITFLGGFVLGALAGAAVAALMASQSGDALKTQLEERWDLILEEGRRAAAERRAELEAKFAEAKRFVPPPAAAD